MENIFLALNEEWKLYLDSSAEQMQADIRNILTDQIVKYQQGKSRQNIAALYFEYEYDHMDIMFWAEDKNGELITETIKLPTIKRNNTDENSNWEHFLPESIWKKVIVSEDTYEGDDYDDIRSEYDEKKTELFKEWFINCWNTVTKEMENVLDAYFSIHDTNFRTDLKTGKRMKLAEIEERYR